MVEVTPESELNVSVTPDFLQLRELAILANEGDPEPVGYSFTSALLAFLAAHDPTSRWFQQYVRQAGIQVERIQAYRRVDLEQLRERAASTIVPTKQSRPPNPSRSVRALIDEAVQLMQAAEKTSGAPLDVHHLMAAYIYRPASHERQLHDWGFDREDWSNDFLAYLASRSPAADLEGWRRVHVETFKSEPRFISQQTNTQTQTEEQRVSPPPAAPVAPYYESDGPRRRFDEIMAGISFSGPDGKAATITALVRDKATKHVLLLLPGNNITSLQAGTKIYQPALEHGGSAAEPIGVVAERSARRQPTDDPARGMIMAELDGERTFIPQLPNGQPLTRVARPEPKQAIRLFGVASGDIEGRIGQSSRIEGPAYRQEDIGALVVDAKTNVAVGVIVAGDNHRALYHPILPILDALDVEPITEPEGYVRHLQAWREIPAVNDQARGEDRLGIQQYVDAFVKLIKDATPPLTIGIYGAWGSGKSFLMNKIEETLAPPASDRRTFQQRVQALARAMNPEGKSPARVIADAMSLGNIARQIGQLFSRLRQDSGATARNDQPLIVRFEAWDYNASDKLWAGLVERIFREFEDSGRGWYGRSLVNLRRNFERQWRGLRPRLLPYMLVVIVIAVLTIGLTLANQETWATALGGSGVLVLLLGFVQVLVNVLTTPASQRIVELFASSGYTAELGFMKQIKDDLEVFANSLKPGIKVVVFIDDLDRCDPKKAVEVLEAVKLLLDFDRFIVFLALDARIITQVIEEHYGKVLAEAQITGYEYLDKIVQIPFCMPEARPEDLRDYLGSLVDMARDKIPPPLERPAAGGRPGAPPLVPPVKETRTPPATGETASNNNNVTESTEPPVKPPPVIERPATQRQIAEVSFTPDEQGAWLKFYKHFDTNPRRLKRLINIYRLVRVLIAGRPAPSAEGAAPDPLHDPYRVMAWLVLCEQWPYAAHVMLDLLDRGRKAAEAEADPKALGTWQACASIELHIAAQRHIAEEGDRTLRKLDLPYDRLDSFVQEHLANLTLEDVRRLRPFTVNFNPVLSAEVRLTLSNAARE